MTIRLSLGDLSELSLSKRDPDLLPPSVRSALASESISGIERPVFRKQVAHDELEWGPVAESLLVDMERRRAARALHLLDAAAVHGTLLEALQELGVDPESMYRSEPPGLSPQTAIGTPADLSVTTVFLRGRPPDATSASDTVRRVVEGVLDMTVAAATTRVLVVAGHEDGFQWLAHEVLIDFVSEVSLDLDDVVLGRLLDAATARSRPVNPVRATQAARAHRSGLVVVVFVAEKLGANSTVEGA